MCPCPLLALGFQGFFILSFLMQPLTVLMKQIRQAVCAIKQSIYLNVYNCVPLTKVSKAIVAVTVSIKHERDFHSRAKEQDRTGHNGMITEISGTRLF